jgi:hypothetical protein
VKTHGSKWATIVNSNPNFAGWDRSQLSGKCKFMQQSGKLREEDFTATESGNFTATEREQLVHVVRKHQCQKGKKKCHNWNCVRRELPGKLTANRMNPQLCGLFHQWVKRSPSIGEGPSATQGAAALAAMMPAMSQATVPTPATLGNANDVFGPFQGNAGMDGITPNNVFVFSPLHDAVLDAEVNRNRCVDDEDEVNDVVQV